MSGADFIRSLPIDVRAEQSLHGIADLPVLVLAPFGAVLRQIFLFHNIGEQFRVPTVSDAQHVVEALRVETMYVGKRGLLQLRLLCIAPYI